MLSLHCCQEITQRQDPGIKVKVIFLEWTTKTWYDAHHMQDKQVHNAKTMCVQIVKSPNSISCTSWFNENPDAIYSVDEGEFEKKSRAKTSD